MESIKKELNLFFEECFYLILKHEQQYISNISDGLSVSEIHLLTAVERNKDTRAKDISKSLKITAGSLTVAANTLINKGYLEKRQDGGDKRIYRLRLTGKGKKAVELHDDYHNDFINAAVKNLNDDELEALVLALSKIKEFTKIYED